MIVETYVAHLAISIALTVWVARTLSKNGRVFLVDSFASGERLANSVNHLLVTALAVAGFVAAQAIESWLSPRGSTR